MYFLFFNRSHLQCTCIILCNLKGNGQNFKNRDFPYKWCRGYEFRKIDMGVISSKNGIRPSPSEKICFHTYLSVNAISEAISKITKKRFHQHKQTVNICCVFGVGVRLQLEVNSNILVRDRLIQTSAHVNICCCLLGVGVNVT